MTFLSEYLVTVTHPVLLPEGEETQFTDARKALRLQESAEQAGFTANIKRVDPLRGVTDNVEQI